MILSSGLKRTTHSPYEETCIFNEETGEVVAIIPPQSAVKIPSITKDIGIDLPHPSEAKTADQLLELAKMMDVYAAAKLKINHSFILDMELNIGQNRTLLALCKHIVVWNVVFISNKELNNLCAGLRSRKVLSELSAYIKIKRDFPYRNMNKIMIHPFIAWKGGYLYKETALQAWYDSEI